MSLIKYSLTLLSVTQLLLFLVIQNVVDVVQCSSKTASSRTISRMLLITAISDPEDEMFIRFNKSVEAFSEDISLIVLGTKEEWQINSQKWQDPRLRSRETMKNDFMKTDKTNSTKFDLFVKALETYKNEDDVMILWIEDPTYLIMNGGKRDMIKRLPKNVDIFLPKVSINSPIQNEYGPSTIMGFASALWTSIFANKDATSAKKLNSLRIGIDRSNEVFQEIVSWRKGEPDLRIEFNSIGFPVLKNLRHKSEPIVVFTAQSSNSLSKIALNSLGNYLGKAWSKRHGCRDCSKIMKSRLPFSNPWNVMHDFSQAPSDVSTKFPTILIGIFIIEPTPFMDEFFEWLHNLNYPRDRIHLFIYNSIVDHHDQHVNKFIEKFKFDYLSVNTRTNGENNIFKSEQEARNYVLKEAINSKIDYYFSLDSNARPDEMNIIINLIAMNKTIIAPLMNKHNKLWSNFWGSLNEFGYYSRSWDYIDIVRRDKLGIWSVAHLSNVYLIEVNSFKRSLIRSITSSNNYDYNDYYFNEKINSINFYHDFNFPSMNSNNAFCDLLRQLNIPMHLTNWPVEFGHLIDTSNYNISHKHPDLYELSNNMLDWEQKYIHDNYNQVIELKSKPKSKSKSKSTELYDKHSKLHHQYLEEPCPDVYWFPIVNELFCKHIIETMENFGQWSGGTNDDSRIEGGYENVPTRDIHFKQIGLHAMWLLFLKTYVRPVQMVAFEGYDYDNPEADLAFVVRYNPAEQSFLRPHHDSSTYTMNIALNKPKLDYQGGGCHFIRYNCSVVDSRVGWALIHPGRLTHYHEGLKVTKGTRYVLVTFIDP